MAVLSARWASLQPGQRERLLAVNTEFIELHQYGNAPRCIEQFRMIRIQIVFLFCLCVGKDARPGSLDQIKTNPGVMVLLV